MKRLKLSLMFCLALFATLSASQEAYPQTVTFQCPASPLAKVLPALAKAIGLRLACQGQIGNTVVLVRAKDVDPKVLMAKIAEAASGKWTKDADVYTLSLDADRARDEARMEQIARVEAIKKALESLSKQGASASAGLGPAGQKVGIGTDSSISLERAAAGGTSSTQKVLIQLLQMIGPQTLSLIGDGARVVFAMPATRVQRPLPAGAAQVINTLLAELPQREGFPVVASKVHLAVSRSYVGDWLMAELRVGDPAGNIIAATSLGIPATPARKPTTIQLTKGRDEAALSPLAAELARLMAAYSPGGGMAAHTSIVTVVVKTADADEPVASPPAAEAKAVLSDKARAALLNPEKDDPLAYFPGEALQAVADAERVNLVACIPDSALMPAALAWSRGKFTVQDVVSKLADWRMVGQIGGGFLTIRPAEPASARALRLDRNAAGTALRLISSQGYLTLDQRAAYVNSQPFVGPEDTFEKAWLSAIAPGFGSSMLGGLFNGERKMLKFYALLGAGHRQALFAGRGVLVGALPPAAKSLVYDMAYNNWTSSLTVDRSQGNGPRQEPMPSPGPMADEATEVLPNGIPEQATITLQTRTADAVYGVSKSGTRVALIPGTATIMYPGDPSTGMNPTALNFANQYSEYQLGKQTRLLFRFQLLPRVWFTRTLVDDRVEKQSKLLKYSELPAWYQRQAEETQNRIEQIKGRIGEDLRSGQRPPSP